MHRFFLSFLLLSVTLYESLHAAASCTSPTATITLNSTLNNQLLDKPFLDGGSHGEALYYKIDTTALSEGDLLIQTEIDSAHTSDTVDTYGNILDASCNDLYPTDTEMSTHPRLFQHLHTLPSGVYYLRVYNVANTHDHVSPDAMGYFQISNTFTPTLPARAITVDKSPATGSINSGDLIGYTISVTNDGSDPITSITVQDPIPSSSHLTYQGMSGSSDWSCTSTIPTTCTYSGLALNHGDSTTFAINYKADYQTYSRTVTAHAVIEADYSGTAITENTADTSLTINPASASIQIDFDSVQTGTDTLITSAIVGSDFDFNITVTNTGDIDNSGVYFDTTNQNELAVIGLTYDSSVWSCSYTSTKIDCNLTNPLAPGASESVRAHVDVVGPAINNLLSNSTATASSALGGFNDSDTNTMDLIASTPAVQITKTPSGSSFYENEVFYYVLYVKNTGNVPLTNISIDDTLPANLSFYDTVHTSAWSCNAASPVICTLSSTLDVNQTKSVTLKVTGNTAGVAENNATVSSTEGATDTTSAATVTILPAEHGVDVTKSVLPNVYALDTFDYTISVENNGSEMLDNIVVTDTLDTNFTLPSDWNSNTAPWSCSNSGNSITCSYSGTLASTAVANLITLKVKAPYVMTTTTIDNTAVADAQSGASLVAVHDESTVSVNIIPISIGHTLNKTVSTPTVKSGESFTYTITVDNNGSIDLQDIVVTDTLPSLFDGNFTLNSGVFDCSESNGTSLKCKLAYLAYDDPAASFSIDVTAPVVTASTLVTNTADTSVTVVDLGTSDSKTSSVDVTINPPDSVLSIVKDVSVSSALANESFDYTIYVNNFGLGNESNITVTDTVPSEFNITAVSGTGWSCGYSAQDVTCTLPTLVAGDISEDIVISVQAPSTIAVNQTIDNYATVTSSSNPTGTNSNYATVTLLPASEALTITKTGASPQVYAGDAFSYTIEVINNSDKNITDINITDVLPADMLYSGYNGFGFWDCSFESNSSTLSCHENGNTLENGTKKIQIDVIAPSYEVNLTNTATMTSDLDSETREDNATTEVLGKSGDVIFSVAEVDKPTVLVGENFTYSLKVFNNGTAPTTDINLSNVYVEFNLSSDITYVSHSGGSGWSCSYSAPILGCTLASLAVGAESDMIELTGYSATPINNIISYAKISADEDTTPTSTSIAVSVQDSISADIMLAMSDSEDPVEVSNSYNYVITVANPSAFTAKDLILDINFTSSDKPIYNSFSSGSDWSCTISPTGLQCSMLNDLTANSTRNLNLYVDATAYEANLTVEANVWSHYVNDTNTTNNSAVETTNVIVTDTTLNTPREFTKVVLQEGVSDLNIYGDILTVGNQSICEKNGVGSCQEPSYFVNDWIDQKYANLDTYASAYKTSTSATVTFDNTTDEVIWAGLYWMGRIDKSLPGYQALIDDSQRVYLRHDSNTTGYVEVKAQRSASAIDNNGTLINVDKYNYINIDNQFDYQGVADVTDYVKAHGSGKYWVADIKSSEGYNLSAGWNLVVVVRDRKTTPTRELKNITIFDGFQGVWKTPDSITDTTLPREVNQTVSGFLTPVAGAITSNLVFFGFEGDRTLSDFVKVSDSTGTMYDLNNSVNPSDDAVNGTISKNGLITSTRQPALSNTSGIDIDEYDLSSIIDNSQTSTTISIGSLGMVTNQNGGDKFFLGMFGFSTNLNDPVCYVQTLKDETYAVDLGTTAYVGEEIGIEVEFRNIEIQTLYNIHSFIQLDEMFKEDQSTFELWNIAEAGYTSQDPLFTYKTVDNGDANVTEVNTSIGSGATSTQGGYMMTGDSVYMRFNATLQDINDDNLTHNLYSVSYDPNPNNKISIARCSGVDQTLTVLPVQTNGFEMTHTGGLSDDGVNDGLNNGGAPSNENHLFTQVADQPFAVDVVALEDGGDPTQLRTTDITGLFMLEVVDYNQTLVEQNDTTACQQFQPLSQSFFTITSDTRALSVPVVSPSVTRTAGLRVRYVTDAYGALAEWPTALNTLSNMQDMLNNISHDDECKTVCLDSPDIDLCRTCLFTHRDYGGMAEVSCSSDLFAIKPENIALDVNESSPYIGGKPYTLELNATSSEYNQSLSVDNISYGLGNGRLYFDIDEDANASLVACPEDNESVSTMISFDTNGSATVNPIQYNNVGLVNLEYVDNDWTAVDQNSSNAMMSDCIQDDASNTPVGGKVGCNVGGTKELYFKPHRIDTEMFLDSAESAGNFTYLSNDVDMSAQIRLRLRAELFDTSTATNYDQGCFARALDLTFDLNSSFNADTGIDPTRLRMHEDNITTKPTIDPLRFEVPKSVFTLGNSVDVNTSFNFQRTMNLPDNPFRVQRDHFELSISDDNGTTFDGNYSGVNDATDFYYARVHLPDIETDQSDFNATVYYEIYCAQGCDGMYALTQNPEAIDSINWRIVNDTHHAGLGSYNMLTVDAKNGTYIATPTIDKIPLSLGAIAPPHHDKITVTPDSWLRYDQYLNSTTTGFTIHFLTRDVDWSGAGEKGHTVDSNISTKNAKKMEW